MGGLLELVPTALGLVATGKLTKSENQKTKSHFHLSIRRENGKDEKQRGFYFRCLILRREIQDTLVPFPAQ